MKKRLISTLLIMTMLCSIGSHVTAQEPTQEPTPVLSDVVEMVEFTTAYHRDGDVPAQSRPMDGITPPITAMVMSMLEQDMGYNPNDDDFYWNSLYYMLSLYGQMDCRAEITDETLILPTEAVEDYAAALFHDMIGLPQLTQAMEGRVDCVDGQYYLARGDAGLATIQIDTTQEQAGGIVIAAGRLINQEEGNTLCTFTVKLQSNNSMFEFAIDDVVIQP